MEHFFDRLFKSAVLLLLFAYLIIYFESKDIQRFQLQKTESAMIMVDTKTGKFYSTSLATGGKWVEFDPLDPNQQIQVPIK